MTFKANSLHIPGPYLNIYCSRTCRRKRLPNWKIAHVGVRVSKKNRVPLIRATRRFDHFETQKPKIIRESVGGDADFYSACRQNAKHILKHLAGKYYLWKRVDTSAKCFLIYASVPILPVLYKPAAINGLRELCGVVSVMGAQDGRYRIHAIKSPTPKKSPQENPIGIRGFTRSEGLRRLGDRNRRRDGLKDELGFHWMRN